MKRWFKYLLYLLITFIVILTMGFFIPYQWNIQKSCQQDTIPITISSNGYHTSFIMLICNGLYDWNNELSIPKGIRFIEFSWGNREFYMNRNFSITATLHSLFPSQTVVHIAYLYKPPEKIFIHDKNQKIKICPEDYRNIVNYIRKSFATDSNGKKIYLGNGLYGPSAFYLGTGSYHAFNTCNTWVAKGLRTGNVKTPIWAGTAQAVMWHIRNYD